MGNNLIIVFLKDDLSWNLFPNISEKSSNGEIIKSIQEFYLNRGCDVKVSVENNIITVEFSQNNSLSQSDIEQISKLAQRKEYERARNKIKKLLELYPTESELYRFYGQTLSDEGNVDEAEKWLIDCLKYNPDNKWGLVMLGNIYNQLGKKDLAKKLYKRALEKDDKDIYALSNYGSLCLELEDNDEAKRVLEKALKINENYWVTNYLLGIVYFRERKFLDAFDLCVKAWNNIDKNDSRTQSIFKLLINICFSQDNNLVIEDLYIPLKEQLEKELGKKIIFKRDDGIQSLAKVKIAEYYGTDEHIVLFNPKNNGYKYSIMHELMHLKMISDARKFGKNKVISSTKEQENFLIEDMKLGLGYMKIGLEGQFHYFAENILTQIYNSPLDLYIEDYIYNTYKELRPSQFLFQIGLIMQGIDVAKNVEMKKTVPNIIYEANIIMNSILARQINDLYGIDKIGEFGHNSLVRLGKKLYDKFNIQKDSMAPGDEYKLVELRAEKLGYSKYLSIENEKLEGKGFKGVKDDSENLSLSEIESQVKKLGNDSNDINMSVVMYCLSAIRFFKNKSQKEIEMIGYELAIRGAQGIKYGEDSKYFITSIPGKQFSGYEFLSYMYVAWQILKPEADLGLDYSKEYKIAKQLNSKK